MKLRWDTKNKDVTFNLELKSQIPVVSTFTWYELKYKWILSHFLFLTFSIQFVLNVNGFLFFAWSSAQWSESCSPAYYRVSIFTISLYYIYWFFSNAFSLFVVLLPIKYTPLPYSIAMKETQHISKYPWEKEKKQWDQCPWKWLFLKPHFWSYFPLNGCTQA